MPIAEYLQSVISIYEQGNGTEHSYRPALQQLLHSLSTGVTATNEPKREKCGAPDYILTRGQIPIGYIEAKDILPGILDKRDTQAQVHKYFDGELGYNFLLTDYVEFRFYRGGTLVETVRIADRWNNALTPLPDHYEKLRLLLESFLQYRGQTLTSSAQLAEMMAGKARMMRQVIREMLADADDHGGEIGGQLQAFRRILIHDLSAEAFADMYAQTITYGLFAARYVDPTLPTFDRYEAAQLLPKTNPFLRNLFGQIGAVNFDERLRWIVDDLIEVFKACNVAELLAEYGVASQRHDPIVHFYEDFLASYDPALRKARGVWYTPQSVVDWIVQAVDAVLVQHFGLPMGLSDTSKITVQYGDGPPRDLHSVQILDPATGTGTFLARVVEQVHRRIGVSMPALWPQYVAQDLLPRLHGFELLMASYAMAHLKMDIVLRELGAPPPERVGIYLTNSLEESHPDTDSLFSQWLSDEGNAANRIKRETPVMCVLGNPPYSGISSNKGDYITRLIEDYKYVNGVHFGEKKHWLGDDYVKFLRLAEHLVEKNGEGVVGYITNHGYLDNPTFRGMRWHLLQTFDDIYVVDLHGNSLKKEMAPDGSADQNVFDIMAGVAIFLGVKTGKKPAGALARVHHTELYGKRQEKYAALEQMTLQEAPWTEIENRAPYYFFVPKNYDMGEEYNKGMSVREIFPVNGVGVVTARDSFCIDGDKKELQDRIMDYLNTDTSDSEVRRKYGLKNSSTFKLSIFRERARQNHNNNLFKKVSYRPFDNRWIYYTKDVVERPGTKHMRHMLAGENVGLAFNKPAQGGPDTFTDIFVSNTIVDQSIYSAVKRSPHLAPSTSTPKKHRPP